MEMVLYALNGLKDEERHEANCTSRTFLGQVPFIIFCTLVGIYALKGTQNEAEATPSSEDVSSSSHLRNIDFAGIVAFSATTFIFLLLLRATGIKADNAALQICVLFLSLLISGAVFITIELFWARKPIIPVPILLKELGLYCLIQVLLHSGRTAVCSRQPLVTCSTDQYLSS
jgi:hypothetical protein